MGHGHDVHYRRRGRHHHRGGQPWERRMHMAGGWFGHDWSPGRRAKRGDVRAALLALLVDAPMHGYDLIRELEERSSGMWRPSPGSIYPTLQLLEDEGLVTSEQQDGKRVYSITDAGRAEVESRKERSGGAAPWDLGAGHEGIDQLREAGFQLAAAAMQVARAGTAAQMKRAAEILAEARKQVYAILAEG